MGDSIEEISKAIDEVSVAGASAIQGMYQGVSFGGDLSYDNGANEILFIYVLSSSIRCAFNGPIGASWHLQYYEF